MKLFLTGSSAALHVKEKSYFTAWKGNALNICVSRRRFIFCFSDKPHSLATGDEYAGSWRGVGKFIPHGNEAGLKLFPHSLNILLQKLTDPKPLPDDSIWHDFCDVSVPRHKMSGQNTAFAVYAIPTAAMRAIERLRNSECEVEFSVVAKEERETKQNKELIYDSWYQLWSLLPDWSRFGIPQMGPILMTGPMSRLMVNVLNNASMFDGLNALEACLHSIGVPGDKILACEAAVQAGGILVLIHGTSQEVARAREIVANASTTYKESDHPPTDHKPH